jgi:hypothetical protein
MATIGTPHKLDGPRVAGNSQDRHVLRIRDRIVVITGGGGVFAHDLAPDSREVGPASQLTGPKVDAQRKFVIALGDSIAVIHADGRVFSHPVGAREVGAASQLTGPKVGAKPQDKFVLGLGGPPGEIAVITRDGRVFVHPILIDSHNKLVVGDARQRSGPKVAANPQDKFVLAMARSQRLVVITEDGGVFAHDLGSGIGTPSPLSGPKIAIPEPANPLYRFALEQTSRQGNRILVINIDGDVFACDIGGFPVVPHI